MKVCPNCAREMRCEKNGVACIFHGTHIYFGDKFTCDCGNSCVVTNSNASYIENYIPTEDDIIME